MKDYSYGENKEFILGYKIKDGQIIIKYPKNKKLSFPYSKEKEIKILDIMKKQAIENKNIAIEEAKDDLWSGSCFSGVYVSLATISAFALAITTANAPFFSLILASGLSLVGSARIISSKSCLDDIKKSTLFLENESKITDMMQENIKSLDKTLIESKTAKMYNELQNRELTLNNIDKLSLKDLKKILESIEHSKTFGVETTAAFEKTLEALQKIDRKEKVKRKIK